MTQPRDVLRPPRKKPAVEVIFAGEKDGQKGEWYLQFDSKEEFDLYIYVVGAVRRREEEEKAQKELEDTVHAEAPPAGGDKSEELRPGYHMRRPRPHPMIREFRRAAREKLRQAKAIAEIRYNLRSRAVLQPSLRLRRSTRKKAGPYLKKKRGLA